MYWKEVGRLPRCHRGKQGTRLGGARRSQGALLPAGLDAQHRSGPDDSPKIGVVHRWRALRRCLTEVAQHKVRRGALAVYLLSDFRVLPARGVWGVVSSRTRGQVRTLRLSAGCN